MISAWFDLVTGAGEKAGQTRINNGTIEFRPSSVRGTPPSLTIDNETRRMDPFYGTGKPGDHLDSIADGALGVGLAMGVAALINSLGK